MSNLPSNFQEALSMSVEYSKRYLHRFAEWKFAELSAKRAQHHLEYARRMDYPQHLIEAAEEAALEAYIDVESWRHAELCESIGTDHSYTSYDGHGLEIYSRVNYDPRNMTYDVWFQNELDETFCGSHSIIEAAIAHAKRAVYGDDDEVSRPSPTVSREESNLAGEIEVAYRGEVLKVKVVVERILHDANKGCGQHYEIFERRAADALSSLPAAVPAEFRSQVSRYLEYSRY